MFSNIFQRRKRVAECAEEYLREKTVTKSAGTRHIEVEIRYQERVERAKAMGKPVPSMKPKKARATGTQYFDRMALEFFVKTLPEGITLPELTIAHLLRHRRLLLLPEDPKRRPLKPQSITRREGPIFNLLNYAVKMKYITASPAEGIERLKPADETQRRALKVEEIVKLLETAEPWLARVLLFAAETAARRAQISFFTFGSIVWEKNEARFESKRKFNPKDRKTNIVPLTERMVGVLRKIKAEAEARGKAGPSDFVFTDQKGRFLRPDRITKATHKHIRKELGPHADVGAAIHAMRRTAATLWHERGASLIECQTLMGHSSPNTTQKYIRTSTERLRAVIKNIGF